MPEAPQFDELKDFTLKSYVKLLRYLKQIYKIVPFCELPREETHCLILRHDVDVSLSAALKMAQIESDLGIKSTYFVLFSGRFYNLLAANNVSILKQISKLGHEVGLHYSTSHYLSYNRNLNKTLKIEIQLLEHLLERKVYSIARHGTWDRDPFATTKEYINANHPRLQRDLFIIDSCRAWSPPQGLLKLLNDPPRRAQLLTHPENWQSGSFDRETLIEKFIQDLEEEILTLKTGVKKIWLTDPAVLEYDALLKKREFVQFNKEVELDSVVRSKLRELNYYNRLFRWYIINTSLGWQLHKVISKIRGATKKWFPNI